MKVLDPTPDCPASVVAEQVVGSFRDPEVPCRMRAGRAETAGGWVGWQHLVARLPRTSHVE